MLSKYFHIVFITLFTEYLLVSAVNSPQMTFFTPPSHETTIHLESKYGYSATLKLFRPKNLPSSLPASRFSRSSNSSQESSKERKLAEYIVLGPDYPFHGVTAVIQEMNLREGYRDNECTDFVQFSKNSSISTRTSRICGYISKEDNWVNDTISDTRRQRTFFNPDGVIHIYFYSDPNLTETNFKYTGGPEVIQHIPKSDEDQDIGIEIVFTSYTVCPNPANSWKKLKACSTTDQMSCIYSTLFCDSKIDCGFPGEFGIDEVGCIYPYIYMTLTIVFSILLTITLIYLFVRWVTKVPKEFQ